MECQTCFESLTAFIDGEVARSDADAIQQHLDACPGCLEQYESLHYATRLLDSLPEPYLAAPSFGPIESRLPRAGSRFFDWGGFLVPRWVPAGALATLLLFFSVPFYWTTSSERDEMERMFTAFVEERERLEQEHLRVASESRRVVISNPFTQVSQSGDNPFSLR